MARRSSTYLVVASFIGGAEALKANSWQARLDKSLLSVDLGVGSRLRLFKKVVQDPLVQEDLRSAVALIQEQGFGKGHPAAIELLWPTGTTARSDIEGLTALRKQFPEALKDLQAQPPAFPSASDAPPLPDPATVLSNIASLATDQEKQKELREEAKDLLRQTPKGLETPKYKVVRTVDGPLFLGKPEPVELRSYEQYTVAKTSMPSGSGFGASGGAEGFNKLASYLFGKNVAEQEMAMTMPVAVSDSEMAFVLPRRFGEDAPAPLDGSTVAIEKVPARLVAAKAFAGLVTEEEVARQKTSLLEALAAAEEAAGVVPVDGGEVSVLQYNSPLTLPWRRRNEIAIVVTELDDASKTVEEQTVELEVAEAAELEAAEVEAEVAVVSWYDSGVRLS